ncbi:hypothetical protein [Cronobacter phage JC01]|uniref:Uncharacterized protein n=1 Tax=Cronobacter phage JC01 TaxID=2729575 RepID=A0A6M3YKB9_9CAUD|nr:hypothetical protein JT331_gp04 [Cronobacter phage JC01]QJI52223.1 hypothetical protein [Cronobacter phage JC01]
MSGSIELLIEALNNCTAALQAHTAANGNAAGAAADKSASGAKKNNAKPAKPETPKATKTKQETTEAIVALKDTVGKDAAVALLKKHGFAKLADIAEDKFDVLFEEATAQLEAHNAAGDTPADDDF